MKYTGQRQTGLSDPAWSWTGGYGTVPAAGAEPTGHQPPMLMVAVSVNLVYIIKYRLYFMFLLLGNVLHAKVSDSMLMRNSKRKISLHCKRLSIGDDCFSTFFFEF